MNTRTAVRFAIPCVCLAAAWVVTHALRPAPAAAPEVTAGKTTPEPKPPASRPSDVAQKLVAALQSAPSGQWQSLWADFAISATAAELTAVASGEEGMARNLAWEELAARRPEALPALARKFYQTPGLIAAAAATIAAHDPEKAAPLIHLTRSFTVQHAVLATFAWSDPDAARRMADKLPPLIESGGTYKPQARASISTAWTRRDPMAAAAAGFADVTMWARTDAAGALKYSLSKPAEDEAEATPPAWMIAAALRQSPAEAVRLIEAHPVLTEACIGDTDTNYGWSPLTWWYFAAPESCLAAIGSAQEEPSRKAKSKLLSTVAFTNSEAAAALAGRFPELDLEKLQWQRDWLIPGPQLDFDPVAAADALLAALEQHPPAEAMQAAGLTAAQVTKLARLLAAQLPDKARALAAKLPREAFDASAVEPGVISYVRQSVMDELWPAASSKEPEPAGGGMSFHGAAAMLRCDPARYATTVDPSGNDGWAAWNTATNWAPHDLTAASAWVRSLPGGMAKQRAEAAVAMELAVQKPADGLAAMAALPESVWADFRHDEGVGAWLQALHHVALSGGDWQRWQAKTPAPLRARVQTLARDALEIDAALLAVLRKTK